MDISNITENINNKLAWWQKRMTSRVGKMTLIKSNLTGISKYILSRANMPKYRSIQTENSNRTSYGEIM